MQYIERLLSDQIRNSLDRNPVTAIIGARQVGKSTLAKKIVEQYDKWLYLDLEKPSDRILLTDAESFFYLHKRKTICMDEIQLSPDIFSIIRSVVDDSSFRGKFLVLGSASPELLKQTAQTLAGRISYFELTPFLWEEISGLRTLQTYHLRGGFPISILAETDEIAFEWLDNFIITFLERDLRTFGFNLPPDTLHRLWKMIAHVHGQIINYSQLANALGVSQPTVRYYIDVLSKTFMLRTLQPYYANVKKRLVKRSKIYIRDTGILHALSRITTFDDLYAHPLYGVSWEGIVIENIIQKYKQWESFFYRTASGDEIDLVLEKGRKKIAIEIKTSASPKLTKGFWRALEVLQPDETYVIAPVRQTYPLNKDVWVYRLEDFLQRHT